MAALVTPAQLASRLRTTEAALVTTDANLAINNASGLVRGIAHQQFDFVSQETVELSGGLQILMLPERPVVVDGSNPLAVVELGDWGAPDFSAVEGVDFQRHGNELRRGHPAFAALRLGGWPHFSPRGVWAPRVRVTYSHGYATLPDDVISIALDVAASLYDNPTGLRQMSIDDYTEIRAAEILGAATVASIKEALSTTGRRKGAFSIHPS
jgi:hypothetical protein